MFNCRLFSLPIKDESGSDQQFSHNFLHLPIKSVMSIYGYNVFNVISRSIWRSVNNWYSMNMIFQLLLFTEKCNWIWEFWNKRWPPVYGVFNWERSFTIIGIWTLRFHMTGRGFAQPGGWVFDETLIRRVRLFVFFAPFVAKCLLFLVLCCHSYFLYLYTPISC